MTRASLRFGWHGPAALLAAALCFGGDSPVPAATDSSTRPAATTRPAAVTAAEVAANYRRYPLASPKPVRVSLKASALCAPAAIPAAGEVMAPEDSGPHATAAIRVYMNRAAADAFASKKDGYPVGAVVVKEKLSARPPATRPTGGSAGGDEAWEVAGVGGMIKRTPGFAPTDGDWEYFWVEGGSRPEETAGHRDRSPVDAARLKGCADCHRGSATHDHIFGGWAKADR